MLLGHKPNWKCARAQNSINRMNWNETERWMVGCRTSRDIANGTNVPKCMSRWWWMQKAWLLLFINELLQHTWYCSSTSHAVENAHAFCSASFIQVAHNIVRDLRSSLHPSMAALRVAFFSFHCRLLAGSDVQCIHINKHSPANMSRTVWVKLQHAGKRQKKKEVYKIALQWSARVTPSNSERNEAIEIDVKCFSFSFMNAPCNFMSCTPINS